jgi:hypothetical protein
VLDRVLDDRTSVEAARAPLRRDFVPELSDGFVSDCLRRQAEAIDMADSREWPPDLFVGALRVDGLHFGRFTLLPIAFGGARVRRLPAPRLCG